MIDILINVAIYATLFIIAYKVFRFVVNVIWFILTGALSVAVFFMYPSLLSIPITDVFDMVTDSLGFILNILNI